MDEAEIDKLREELRGLIELGPGLNQDGLIRGRQLIERFRSARTDAQVNEHLLGITYGFAKWFSDGDWIRRNDERELVRAYLHDDIVSLRVAMAVWRDTQG